MLSTLNVFKSVASAPETGDTVAIWWQDGKGQDSPHSWHMDTCTVVDTTNYQMTVRVGWIGSMPMLMTFRRFTSERVAESDAPETLPVIHERDGVPLNYRD